MNKEIEKFFKDGENAVVLATFHGVYIKGTSEMIMTLCTNIIKQLLNSDNNINENDFKLALEFAKLNDKELDKLYEKLKEEIQNGK